LLFDVPVKVSSQRLSGARDPDRFEQENRAFFERTRTVYLERAAQFPERFRIIDSNRPLELIHKELENIISVI
jgi:dTMP kinase